MSTANPNASPAVWSNPRTWIALVSVGLVLWAVRLSLEEEPGPGPLSEVHAAVDTLRGASGCVQCHGPAALGEDARVAAMQAACEACHTPIARQLREHTGFHGLLANGADCARCHGEHLGYELEPYELQDFVTAGFAAREAYDHAGLEFVLEGAHTGLACAACHPLADAPSTVVAAQHAASESSGRFLGQSQTCTACHEDVHEGDMGGACADCHGQSRPFAEVERFEHTATFALAGAHSGHACSKCHEPNSPRAIAHYKVEATTLVGPSLPARTCAECHASPHGAAFVHATGSNCAACHGSEQSGFLVADEDTTRDVHGATGFVLADAHAALACEACHGAQGDFLTRYPGREQNACAICHHDPHGGQFGDPSSEPSLCVRCHAATSFAVHFYDAVAHAASGFVLDGAHASVGCAECHGPDAALVQRGDATNRERPLSTPGLARYRGTPRTCAACHDDVHEGAFDHGSRRESQRDSHGATVAAPERAASGLLAAIAAPVGGLCANCHDTGSFQDALERFEHGRWTGFDLAGSHAAATCVSCHPTDADTGRRLGLARTAYLPGATAQDVAGCAACHVDPHAGGFDGSDVPTEVDGRVGCARCHDERAFRDVSAARFDHGRWTGFELRGAHAHMECVACHGVAEAETQPGQTRRLGLVSTRFPGSSERCSTCHIDPHGERYDVHVTPVLDGREGCARCHGETSFRAVVAFDHAWTGHELEGVHAALDCDACHALQMPDAEGRVRAAALGTSCADCHVDPHAGQFRIAGRNDCARCHVTGDVFQTLDFDHDKDSRFVLDDVHKALECAACHRPARTRDGVELVRYRPLGTTCAECHGTTDPSKSGGTPKASIPPAGRPR